MFARRRSAAGLRRLGLRAHRLVPAFDGARELTVEAWDHALSDDVEFAVRVLTDKPTTGRHVCQSLEENSTKWRGE